MRCTVLYVCMYVCMCACIYTHALRGYALRITYDVLNFRIVVKRIRYLHAVKQHRFIYIYIYMHSKGITYDVLNFWIVVKRICYLHAVKQHGFRGAQTRARLVLIDD